MSNATRRNFLKSVGAVTALAGGVKPAQAGGRTQVSEAAALFESGADRMFEKLMRASSDEQLL